MNSKPLWIVIIIVLIALGAWFALAARNGDTGTNNELSNTQATTTVPVETPAAKTVTVTYSDSGFSPTNVALNAGDTVTFVNNSASEMWVAVDEHPTHTEFDGTATSQHCADGVNTNGSFDQCGRVGNGASWSYTFTKTGSFDYHNHARASHGGMIVVD